MFRRTKLVKLDIKDSKKNINLSAILNNYKMNRAILKIFLLLFSYSSFSQSHNIADGFTGTVKILHTNDIHGNFSRFPRLAFVVDSIRNVHENVLLLNAGDIFTGNPLVDMDKEKGFQMIELMNKVGYDLSTLGNHEFDYGQNVLSLMIIF